MGTPEYEKSEWRALEDQFYLLDQALDVLKMLDEDGDSYGRCVLCRGTPCRDGCSIREILVKSGRKAK